MFFCGYAQEPFTNRIFSRHRRIIPDPPLTVNFTSRFFSTFLLLGFPSLCLTGVGIGYEGSRLSDRNMPSSGRTHYGFPFFHRGMIVFPRGILPPPPPIGLS